MPDPYSPVTIAISGGHLTPAVATIEYLQKHHPGIKIIFIGRQYSQERERQVAKEQEVCERLGIPFFSIPAAKFHRTAWWRNIEELPKILPSFLLAFRILRQNKVHLFLSFGGYLAVPLAAAAKLLGKKVVTHEQTKTTGLANELIALFAHKVAISAEESRSRFPKEKVVLTGNPIRSSLLRTYTKPPSWIPQSNKPLLYITGGSQGSQVINNAVSQILDELTQKFLVIHQCGQSEHQHYLRTLESLAQELSLDQQKQYVAREWIDEKEVSWIMQHAVLAVSRSGANTTLELSLHSLPAIFIPLPFAHNDEQTKNAKEMVENGGALLLEQKDLSPQTLLSSILEAYSDRAKLRRRAQRLRATMQVDGAKQLTQLCLYLLGLEDAPADPLE